MTTLAAWILAAATSAAAAPPAGTRPVALQEIGFDQRLGEAVPLDLRLRDEQGRTVVLRDLFQGRPVVLSLVYYECPMLCTLSLNGLVSALDVLKLEPGTDFDLITVSFDDRESPDQARKRKNVYLNRYRRPSAAGAWHFLTGERAELDRLTKAVGFRYAWDEETKQFAHAAGVVVLTPQGVISRYLYGIEYAPKDLRFALMESAERRIGTAADALILTCYRYDPVHGRYGAYVMGILRLAALATVVVLGGFVAVMLRRERKS